MSRARMTTREERLLIEKLGGLSVVLNIIQGRAQVEIRQGKTFRPFGSIILSPSETIEVTFVSGKELGITEPAPYETVFAAARKAGLRICREGVVSALNRTWDYRDVRIGALLPPEDSEGSSIRLVELCREFVLAEDTYDPGHLFSPDDVWVFELPPRTIP